MQLADGGVPSNFDELQERLKTAGTDSSHQIEERLAAAKMESKLRRSTTLLLIQLLNLILRSVTCLDYFCRKMARFAALTGWVRRHEYHVQSRQPSLLSASRSFKATKLEARVVRSLTLDLGKSEDAWMACWRLLPARR